MTDTGNIPFRDVRFPSARMRVTEQPDGTLIVDPEAELQPFEPNLMLELERRADAQPDKPYLLERGGADDDWQALSYGEARSQSHAVAQWLLDNDAAPDRSLLILSGNSRQHAVMKYGAMAAGVPVCPVSVNYSLMGGDYARLRHVIGLVRPAVVFAEQTAMFAKALDGVDFGDARVVTGRPEAIARPAVATADVLSTKPGPDVRSRIDALDPDSAAFYMLTSGSTSLPKAVVQTHRMVTANLAQGRQVLGETAGWKDVMLDWLPWNHVSGAFTQMGVMTSGGTLYIDGGRPLPGEFDTTIRNLKDVPVSFFTNVPAGYAMLVDALEQDAELREAFFSRLRLALYGGAGLSQPLYDRFQQLAADTIGRRVRFTTGYGSTETTSGCMAIYFESEAVGIGLPMPGLSLKLVPFDRRYEVRLKGPMVTSGYLHGGDTNADLFDDDGYFRIGDAAEFIEPGNIQAGLRFAGRLAEEFKLANGTWVSAGNMRTGVIQACAPYVSDVLVCGLDREYVAILAWPNTAGIARLPERDTASGIDLADDPALRTAIVDAIENYNSANPGSSRRIGRFAFLAEPPSPGDHEISDKGTINQAVALGRRQDDVERLYAARPDTAIIDFSE